MNDPRFADLLEVADRQNAAISASLAAEQLRMSFDPAAHEAFERYFELARAWLAAALRFNASWPADAVDVQGAAGPSCRRCCAGPTSSTRRATGRRRRRTEGRPWP